MKSFVTALAMIVIAVPALAGPNADVSLAMHTVASYEYLYCEDLASPRSHFPLDCGLIDNSATPPELDASYGYVYVCFVAYNVAGITGVEYCIAGWPSGRGAPPTPLLNYCPATSLLLGDPWAGGGIQAFGELVLPHVDAGGSVVYAWFVWGAYSYTGFLPVTLEYCASEYSYPASPHNYVLGPAPNFIEDTVNLEFGCTIWGVCPVAVPYEDCDPETTPTDPTTWSKVKEMYK
jgi:hypothetical protein